ncbi:MAG: bifunctional DNA-formamidopyrimidine glycosylase/DNA-(apurinic or apyrimidinic site) lyase [Candidatus Latescibacteria bacterium]|nr:bifunctional DNA-formamidopyrimidine glycosylase/DNA-(apurinic or apyrimidinic site) lyase [Candidatus Latescibacterota bacterium]
MPELPEVETIRRELNPYVINRKISKIYIQRPDIIGYPSADVFKKEVTGKTITNLARKAKYLIFELNSDKAMIIHLRLSGQLLVWNGNKKDAPKHERIRFFLSGKKNLSFVEPRVLGRAYLVEKDNYPDVLGGLKELGLEPIDKKFCFDYLYSKLKGRKAPIKNLLLDQSITAGIGNIYSDEALFLAGIHPLTRANKLTLNDIKKLAITLRQVIKAGIKSKGTSISDYLRPDGKEGGYQFCSYVFDREGEKCRKCGTLIEFKKIGNRRTRFCPKCQAKK